jgi:hypothetical protein
MGMTVDEFVQAKVRPEFHGVVQALRDLMRECAPDATEMISYGIPTWKGRKMLAVISPTQKDITFSFSRGAEFADPHGLLRGEGKVSKHVKIKDVEHMPTDALRDYIRQALAIDAGAD